MGFICNSALSDWCLELSEQVTLLSPRNICSPMPGWLTRLGIEMSWVSWGLADTESSHRSPDPIASLAQGPHPSHSKARGSRQRGDPLPTGSESSSTHSPEVCNTRLQTLCRGRGRDVARQAGRMLLLKWLFLLSFGVHSSLNCIFNRHKQADIFSIRNA